MIKEVSLGNDGSISMKNLKNCINNDLANNYGNLCQRVFSFIKKNCNNKVPKTNNFKETDTKLINNIKDNIPKLIDLINKQNLNEYIKKVVVSDEEIQTKNVSEFFNNALNLKAVKVRDFMIPRTEIIAIDEEDSINDLKKIISKTGYTKVIVYQSSIDNVIGYCHGLSLFTNPNKINDILKPIHYVNETNLASDLLLKFISDQINIAVVIDEYGGTSGIITLEDIIEEIFGEIIDEFDELDLLEDKVDDNSFNFNQDFSGYFTAIKCVVC